MKHLEQQRYWLCKVAESLLHTPYIWGGDDPSGFDCSGLVVECLKSVGIIGNKSDFTADGLWHKYHGRYKVDEPLRGAFAFWFNDKGIATHIAICMDHHFCITADGGGSRVRNLDDAIKYNAFIKVRPIFHRQQAPRFVSLFPKI